jgi:hypothetical protein
LINPLQSRLVQLEAVMHILRGDEQLLLTHLLHVEVIAMPVTTETKSSGLLHPRPVPPLDPPPAPEPPPLEPVPPTVSVVLGFSLLAEEFPLPDGGLVPLPPVAEHPTTALNEPAITVLHTLSMSASSNCVLK